MAPRRRRCVHGILAGAARVPAILAASGPIYGHDDDYAFEPKWDGWRALVSVYDGHVAVRTRTGRVVTTAVPELGDLADDVGGRSVVLDRELVAHQGTPASFYRLGPRMATRRPGLHSTVPGTSAMTNRGGSRPFAAR